MHVGNQMVSGTTLQTNMAATRSPPSISSSPLVILNELSLTAFHIHAKGKSLVTSHHTVSEAIEMVNQTLEYVKSCSLRTFALIVSAHPYCARKSTCHAMPRHASSARAGC